MKNSIGFRIFISAALFIICMVVVVVMATASESVFRIAFAYLASLGAVVFACMFGFSVRKHLIDRDALKKKVLELIEEREKTLESNKTSLVAAAEDARATIRTKDYQEKITLLEEDGLSKIKFAKQVLEIWREKVSSSPYDVKENLDLITFGYTIESEMAITMLKNALLEIEESSLKFVSDAENHLLTLKADIQELADQGYKIDTGLEFFDADMLLQKAHSYLTEENYDPLAASEIAGQSTQLLEIVLRRYQLIEEMRQFNKLAIVDVAVKLESVNERLVKVSPAEIKNLKKYPENVWGKIAARISELQATDWFTDLSDRLREVIDLNTAMFLQPRLAGSKLDQIRLELSNILEDVDAPARLLQRLEKSHKDCLVAIDVIEESLPKIREDFLASNPTPAELDGYDEIELMLRELKLLAKEEKYSDWLAIEKRLNDLMIAFSRFQLEGEKKAKDRVASHQAEGIDDSNMFMGLST